MYEIQVKGKNNQFAPHEAAGTFARKDRALGAIIVLERLGETREMRVEQIAGSADQDEFPVTPHARRSSTVSAEQQGPSVRKISGEHEISVRRTKRALPKIRRAG